MLYFIIIGTVTGLSAGFAPGPLLTLVISETLQHNIKAGVKVAIAPLITDFPIILIAILVLSRLSDFHHILGIISIIGGMFILIMAYNNMLTVASHISIKRVESKSLTKGILANALNPHPYLFWISVGTPIMTKALNQNMAALLCFILSFYTFLIGSKILLAVLIGKSKTILTGNRYTYMMRFLGLALGVLALILFYDGFILLELIDGQLFE